MHHHARRVRLRLDVRKCFPAVHAPRVRDGRHRRRDHLEHGEQDEHPRKSRITGEAHEYRKSAKRPTVRHRRGADRCRHASRKSNVPATDSRASSFDPVFDSCTPHTSPVSSRSRLSRARFLFLALSIGGGATLPAQPVWGVYGEVGGVLGGTWSKTEGAPTVTTGPGALLSLGAQRVSERFSLGAAVRLAAQPVSMSELGDSWSGGTLRDIHVVATTAWPLAQRGAGGLDAEAAVGLAGRLGSVRGEPFASSPSLSPLGELGLAVRRGEAMALFARIGILHLNPTGTSSSTPGAAAANSGWVRRLTVGLRVFR